MKKYAILKDDKVINTCRWDGVTEWNPGDDCIAIEVVGTVGPGFIYNPETATFVPPETPNQPVESDPLDGISPEQLQALLTLLSSKLNQP